MASHSPSPARNFEEVEESDTEFENEMRRVLLGNNTPSLYSRKVFLGGIPPYFCRADLQNFFSSFGPVDIVWPQAENGESEHETRDYGFAVFLSPDSVISLVNKCVNVNGRLSISVSLAEGRCAIIHVRAWLNSNARYMAENFPVDFVERHMNHAVFVGGLPRTVTAKELFQSMSQEYGNVIMAQIEVEAETDYPKGAGCVVFRDRESFLVAVVRRFELFTVGPECTKKVELKPYLKKSTMCDLCRSARAYCFCPRVRCLKYMCEFAKQGKTLQGCWKAVHSDMDIHGDHVPMLRSNSRMMNNTMPWSNPQNEDTFNVMQGVQLPVASLFRPSLGGARAFGRNLFGVVNSIPIQPTPLLDLENVPPRDWNTDCGMFDGRMAGSSAVPRPFSNQQMSRQSPRAFHESNAARFGQNPGNRMQWNRAIARTSGATRGQFSPRRNSHIYYNSSIKSPSLLSRLDWNGSFLNDAVRGPTSDGSNLWAERFSTYNTQPPSKPLVPPQGKQYVRARTSFSPTIRRPVRQAANSQAVKPPPNEPDNNNNLSDNVTNGLSQFKLF
ncbi:hypothetical protein Q1695_010383 [Nippostrongylus brasiliensis]|nr:hypothetical protein Q1695_010383 [Nippostrongylus brasiliensis]